MKPSEATAAARLVERLLADPTLRARFRQDPVSTSRAAGIDSLADELAADDGEALRTLDLRESRSSLAGVLMAAAMEGVGAFEFAHHVLSPDVAAAASPPAQQVLQQVRLPAAASVHPVVEPQGNAAGANAPAAAVNPDDLEGQGDGGDSATSLPCQVG